MQSGSFRLFKFAGIEVSLHFTWFLAAAYFLSRPRMYHSPIFALYEYLGLFVIILLHEFGHAFACRSVGGIANQILLWPFGGVAFVLPPPRPGAELWSIAAGPLVNVFLIPFFALLGGMLSGFAYTAPDFYALIRSIAEINLLILIFNLLPIYPLDGGQILRSLLWFVVGRVKSLQIASVIGLIGAVLFLLYGFTGGGTWLVLLAFFLLSQAITGWKRAKAIQLEDALARETAQPRPPVL